jgi:hypothetical protein
MGPKKAATLWPTPDKGAGNIQGDQSTAVIKQSTHESFTREEPVVPGSDRTFGLVMAAALALVSVANGWHLGRLWPWTSIAALLFGLAAWLRPSSLRLLNRLWMMLGLLMHKVVNPIVMGLLFYGTILPTGLVMRLRGRDLLRLKREPDAPTYWIARAPGPRPETMRDQF